MSDEMRRTVMVERKNGLSVHDIVNAKLKPISRWGIDGYYAPVRDTSKTVPWQAWNDDERRAEATRSTWCKEENVGYIDDAIKKKGWVPAPKYDTLTVWSGDGFLPKKGKWSKSARTTFTNQVMTDQKKLKIPCPGQFEKCNKSLLNCKTSKTSGDRELRELGFIN